MTLEEFLKEKPLSERDRKRARQSYEQWRKLRFAKTAGARAYASQSLKRFHDIVNPLPV